MKRAGLIGMLIMVWIVSMKGQENEVYSRLTMPALQRSLAMYKGQLEFRTGYLHSMASSRFDKEGRKQSYDQTARNFLVNDLEFRLSYGFTDHISIITSVLLANQVESLPTTLYWNGTGFNEVNTNLYIKGLGPMNLVMTYRRPFLHSTVDMKLWGGISVPVTSQTPQLPDHSIRRYVPSDPDGLYIINYRYRFRPGANATQLLLGMKARYRYSKLGIFTSFRYRKSLYPADSYVWEHMLYQDRFIYRSIAYQWMPSTVIQFNIAPAYQLYPWFMLKTSFGHRVETGGWTEETGDRVWLPQRSAGTCSFGFEILVSPTVRVLNSVEVPLYGKEYYSGLSIWSGISLNLVPFKNMYY